MEVVKSVPFCCSMLQLLLVFRYEVEPLPDHFADSCDMERCFDYARCPLSSDFRVFVDQHFSEGCVNDTMYEIISRLLLSPYATGDRYDACLFVVPVCLEEDVVRLNSIETWMGDGRNHVVVPSDDMAVEHLTEIGRALVASDRFPRFRQGFDVFLPLRSVHEATTSDAAALPPQVLHIKHLTAELNGTCGIFSASLNIL